MGTTSTIGDGSVLLKDISQFQLVKVLLFLTPGLESELFY